MKGFIKIEVEELDKEEGKENFTEHTEVQVNLQGVGTIEKIKLLSSFADALEFDDNELFAAVLTLRKFKDVLSGESIKIDTKNIMNAMGQGQDQG